MMGPGETANETASPPPLDDDGCLELVYRVRRAGAPEFSEEQRLCIADIARIGRLDPDQWTAPEIALPADDAETSRNHGVLALDRDHGLRLTYFDVGSENGSFVGDEHVVHCPVLPGMRLRLGRDPVRSEIDLLAIRNFETPRPPPWPHAEFSDLRGESAAIRHLFAALDDLAARGRDKPLIVLQGPDGAGKKAVLWEILRRWHAPDQPELRYVDCRWVALDTGPQPLLTLLRGDAAQLLVLDHLYGLSARHQEELGRVLQQLVERKLPSPPPRVVVFLRASEPHRQHLELRNRGLLKLLRAAPTLWLPSAALCGADEIARFAEMFLARYKQEVPPGSQFHVSACELGPDAIAVLRREAWPQNWGQLRAVVESAALAVAMDKRQTIDVEDLQIGFSELHLPLHLIYERPLGEAERLFRQAYVLNKARRYAGNLSWMAEAMQYSKRGLLKTTQGIDMHDGAQLTLPPVPAWILRDPRRTRDDERLAIALPRSTAWLHTLPTREVAAARRRLVALLEQYPAASIEHELTRLLEYHTLTLDALERALRRHPQRPPRKPRT